MWQTCVVSHHKKTIDQTTIPTNRKNDQWINTLSFAAKTSKKHRHVQHLFRWKSLKTNIFHCLVWLTILENFGVIVNLLKCSWQLKQTITCLYFHRTGKSHFWGRKELFSCKCCCNQELFWWVTTRWKSWSMLWNQFNARSKVLNAKNNQSIFLKQHMWNRVWIIEMVLVSKLFGKQNQWKMFQTTFSNIVLFHFLSSRALEFYGKIILLILHHQLDLYFS